MLEKLLVDALPDKGFALPLANLKVTLFDQAHKSDPLNRYSVIVAEADVGGRACAWIAQGINGTSSADRDTLIKALAGMIVRSPTQAREIAEANVFKLG